MPTFLSTPLFSIKCLGLPQKSITVSSRHSIDPDGLHRGRNTRSIHSDCCQCFILEEFLEMLWKLVELRIRYYELPSNHRASGDDGDDLDAEQTRRLAVTSCGRFITSWIVLLDTLFRYFHNRKVLFFASHFLGTNNTRDVSSSVPLTRTKDSTL